MYYWETSQAQAANLEAPRQHTWCANPHTDPITEQPVGLLCQEDIWSLEPQAHSTPTAPQFPLRFDLHIQEPAESPQLRAALPQPGHKLFLLECPPHPRFSLEPTSSPTAPSVHYLGMPAWWPGSAVTDTPTHPGRRGWAP